MLGAQLSLMIHRCISNYKPLQVISIIILRCFCFTLFHRLQVPLPRLETEDQ